MPRRMRTSQSGIDLITQFEGFRERSTPLEGGGHVIGFGHTKHARPRQRIARDDALTLLSGHDLPPIETAIEQRALAPLSQNEFDALVSMSFNIGLENFLDSEVWALVNSGAKLRAAEAMGAWRKARVDGRIIVVDALVRRRAIERALFLTVEGGPMPAPTPIIRPMLDLASAIMSPREAARMVETESGTARAGEAEREPARRSPTPAPPEDIEDVEQADQPDYREQRREPTSVAPIIEAGEAVAPARPTRRESAPEAAARAVTERLSRILGEPSPKPAPAQVGPSVDEITAAVKELAGEEAEAPAPSSARPARIAEPADLPPLPGGAAPQSPATKKSRAASFDLPPEETGSEASGERPAPTVTFVDDLETPSQASNGPIPRNGGGAPAPWGSLILFALSAFGGALIAAWGLSRLSGAVGGDTALPSDWALYSGPFAILVGGLIFAIMAYYLFRALFSEG